MGAKDEILTLFGFGLDSVIDVISGIGILIMIKGMQHHGDSPKRKPEILALEITAY